MNNKNWIKEIFHAIDKMDTGTFCSFLAEDCVLSFGNMPDVKGKNKIYETIDNFFKSINGLNHNVAEVIVKDDSVISYGIVTYTRLDGNQIAANFCNVFKMQSDLIKNYRIFVDISQLYS